MAATEISQIDQVLSAIRRGVASVPDLRDATGIDYAPLQVLLHRLRYEWKSVRHVETVTGADRYYPVDSEATDGKARQGIPISPEVRREIVEKFQEGNSIRVTAEATGVAKQTAHTVINEEIPKGALCLCGRDARHRGRCSQRLKATRETREMMPTIKKTAMQETKTVTETATHSIETIDTGPPGWDTRVEVANTSINIDGSYPHSALLKKIVWNDEFFKQSYHLLIDLMDDAMAPEEKEAVWTLLKYMKKVERDHLTLATLNIIDYGDSDEEAAQ